MQSITAVDAMRNLREELRDSNYKQASQTLELVSVLFLSLIYYELTLSRLFINYIFVYTVLLWCNKEQTILSMQTDIELIQLSLKEKIEKVSIIKLLNLVVW